MKTPVRTFLIILGIYGTSVIALRLWAQPPAETKSKKKFIVEFKEVGGHPVELTTQTKQQLKKALDDNKVPCYDINYYVQAGATADPLTTPCPPDVVDASQPVIVTVEPSPGSATTSKQLSPHITQRVTTTNKQQFKAVMDLVQEPQ